MVQKHQIQIPVIIASADIQKSTREQVLGLGARVFLNKPCSLQDLQSALEGVGGGSPA
jgi:CheY-like chemotaxis protein